MKYFTPERFIRHNEASVGEAERLEDEWEELGKAARDYYAEIKDRIPPMLAQFASTLCLHDAEWMGLNVSLGHNGDQLPVAVINIRQKNDIISLVYDLYEAPQWSGPSPSSRFWTGDEQLIWLYDEIALLNDTKFSHEILLGNGKVLRLVFFQFNFFINRSISIPREALSAIEIRIDMDEC